MMPYTGQSVNKMESDREFTDSKELFIENPE